jgi:uncharacterized protein (UPF0332 family)
MHDDLLAQARSLAKSDLRRPKQANLRRAISATYYAVFHFLVDQSCRTIIGTQQDKSAFRHVLGRAFVHSDMKAACESFSGGTLKKGASKGLPSGFGIPKEIRHIADTFVELQSKRHAADYDLTERFNRADVLYSRMKAKTAIRRFKQLKKSDAKKFFLVCLLVWKTLANR